MFGSIFRAPMARARVFREILRGFRCVAAGLPRNPIAASRLTRLTPASRLINGDAV
jgi:hypothetical protein